MVMENNGSCYTNDMLQAVEEEIQREEENIRLLAGNMSDEEIRRQAVANWRSSQRLEQAVVNKVIQYFSEEAFRYATVVFTHGDQLRNGQTIEDFGPSE
ncbi:hypothetical protein GBF38_005189 [Nibea albiflora]|uniref:Uncharacterized protein n=1 Tax=Nibea albiflora TaxID=240163 RepID=A0ACB7EVG6_NIBAL|nr:hypothetical protein GBF38_005189 [Nibea albiflora]